MHVSIPKILVTYIISVVFVLTLVPLVHAARLPTVSGDNNAWGTVLNDFLGVSLNETGHLRSNSLGLVQLSENLTLDSNLNILGQYNFSVNSSVLLVDISNSRVGINTQAPVTTLDVQGNINSTGFVNTTILQLVNGGTLLLPNNVVTSAMINSLDASKVTNTVALNNKLTLDASNITGTINDSQLDNDVTIDTTKITRFRNDVYIYNSTLYFVNSNQSIINISTLNTNGSIVPSISTFFDLGSAAFLWNVVYSVNINASGLVNTTQLWISGTNVALNLSHLNISATLLEARQSADNTTLGNRNINTNFPLSGGGSLQSDRTLTFDNTSYHNLDTRQRFDNASLVRTDRNNFIIGGINLTTFVNTTQLWGSTVNASLDCKYLTGGSDSDFCSDSGGSGNTGWLTSATAIYNDTSGINVGIGTSSPISKLDVRGGINSTGFLNTSQLQIANDTIFTNLTGSVGIGTKLPLSKLHILNGDNRNVTTQDLIVGHLGGGGIGQGTSIGLWIGSTENARIETSNDAANGASLRFYTYASSLSERMRITSSGFVGINTTSPTGTLTVKGTVVLQPVTASFSAGNSVISVANSTGGAGSSLTLLSGSGGESADAGNIFIYAEGGGSTAEADSNGGNGGSVTISAGKGGTSGGGAGVGGSGGSIEILGGNSAADGNTGGSVYLAGGTSTTEGNVLLGITSGGVTRGLVGVGTIKPTSVLTVLGDVNVTPSSNSVTSVRFFNKTGFAVLDIDTTNNRIGINTASPRSTLDLIGNLHVTRNVNASGLSVNLNVTPANYVASIGGSINVSNLVNATQLIVSGTDITLNLSRLNVSTTLLEARQAADNSSVARTNVGNTLTGNQNISGSVNASNHIGHINRFQTVKLNEAVTSVNLTIPEDMNIIKIKAHINGTSAVVFINMTINDDEQNTYSTVNTWTDGANSVNAIASVQKSVLLEYSDAALPSLGSRTNRTLEIDISDARQPQRIIGRFWSAMAGTSFNQGTFMWTNRTTSTGVKSVNISASAGNFLPGSWFIVSGEKV